MKGHRGGGDVRGGGGGGGDPSMLNSVSLGISLTCVWYCLVS